MSNPIVNELITAAVAECLRQVNEINANFMHDAVVGSVSVKVNHSNLSGPSVRAMAGLKLRVFSHYNIARLEKAQGEIAEKMANEFLDRNKPSRNAKAAAGTLND